MNEEVLSGWEAEETEQDVQDLGLALRELNSLMSPLGSMTDRLARSQKQLAAAVKTTARSVRNQISGFDELNLIQKETEKQSSSGSRGGKGSTISTRQLTRALNEAAEQLRELNGSMVPGLGAALLAQLPPIRVVGQSFSSLFGGIREKAAQLIGLGAGLAGPWQQLLTVLGSGWQLIGAPAFAAAGSALELLSAGFGSFYNEVLLPLFEGIGLKLSETGAVLGPLWQNFLSAMGSLGEMLTLLWTGKLLPLAEFLGQVFGPLIQWLGQLVMDVMETSGTVMGDVIYADTTLLKSFCTFLQGSFTGDWKTAWGGIRRIFDGVWQGMLGAARGGINLIIDLLNALLRGFTGTVNAMSSAVNRLGVTVPSWVPGIGGKRFAPSLPYLPDYQIPGLARGAVLPANRPFLAVVGDQRRGTNVEAPLDTIRQAVAEVLAASESRSLTAAVPVEVTVDGEVLYRAMNRVQVSRGAEIGGAFAEYY